MPPAFALSGAIAAVGLFVWIPVASAQRAVPIDDRQPDAVVRLWHGDAPGALGSEDRDVPTLTIFRPEASQANGTAVVICPGGGYSGLAPHEGKPVAEWLNRIGVTGLVVGSPGTELEFAL